MEMTLDAISFDDNDLSIERLESVFVFVRNMHTARNKNIERVERFEAKKAANVAITDFLFTSNLLLDYLPLEDALLYIEIYLNNIDIYSMFKNLDKPLFLKRLAIEYKKLHQGGE